jgi:hypothetical protein
VTDTRGPAILRWLLPDRATFTTPVVALVVANVLPLVGVAISGWSAGDLILLYWAENIIVGFYNLLRMLTARGADKVGCGGRAFIAIFFCVHFGGFCAGHGVFVMMLSGVGEEGAAQDKVWLALPLAGLFVSHGISFVRNFIMGGERLRAKVGQLMARPYARIVMLHVAIIAGAAPVMALESPFPLLALLVAFKIGIDIKLHNRSHTPRADEKGVSRAAPDPSAAKRP